MRKLLIAALLLLPMLCAAQFAVPAIGYPYGGATISFANIQGNIAQSGGGGTLGVTVAVAGNYAIFVYSSQSLHGSTGPFGGVGDVFTIVPCNSVTGGGTSGCTPGEVSACTGQQIYGGFVSPKVFTACVWLVKIGTPGAGDTFQIQNVPALYSQLSASMFTVTGATNCTVDQPEYGASTTTGNTLQTSGTTGTLLNPNQIAFAVYGNVNQHPGAITAGSPYVLALGSGQEDFGLLSTWPEYYFTNSTSPQTATLTTQNSVAGLMWVFTVTCS